MSRFSLVASLAALVSLSFATIGCGLQSECGGDLGNCPDGQVCVQNVGKDVKTQAICVQMASSADFKCPTGQAKGTTVQLVPQPALEAGKWGCALPCDVDDDCAKGTCNKTTFQCTEGTVAPATCNPACTAGQTCVNGKCQVGSGQKCTYASDCTTGLCKDGVCASCTSDADCTNSKCDNGTCKVEGTNPGQCQYHSFTYGGTTYCAEGVNSSDLAKMYCFKHSDGKVYLYLDLMAGNIRYDYISFRDPASSFEQVSGNVIEMKSACVYPYAMANGQRLPASWTDPYRAAQASVTMEWQQYGTASYDTSYPNPRAEEWPCCVLLKK